MPLKQWQIVETQLADFEQGVSTPEFQVFLRAVGSALREHVDNPSLLEVGCSSGYYGEVLRRSFPTVKYLGVDFSPSFIGLGNQKFPELNLQVGDAVALEFEDRQFDVVVSGSVLLHVYDWRTGIRESCRVAKGAVILHRTPVSRGTTTLYTKSAYGQKMIEWTFNEDELIQEVSAEGFELVESWPVYPDGFLGDDASVPSQFTYVFLRE